MSAAIEVRGLGKRYTVTHGVRRAGYRTLRESIAGAASALAARMRGARPGPAKEDFWALRDVEFDVQAGEVVGIIGRNGAGKSTLLKILSRITKPTTGEVRLRGRVGALLEVGTGFHPELTGRENIFLNGAILGMSRAEVKGKFDEIVDFSGLEKFLDTPVKRYSSGMHVKLAFSVAAHIQPEVLMVDEVLAVGDIAFQKKCLGKMGDVVREGRTILFVSHQLEALMNLCPTSMLFDAGRLVMTGPTHQVVDSYVTSQQELMSARLADREDRKGLGRFKFTDTWLEDAAGQRVPSVCTGQPVKIVATYETAPGARLKRPSFAFALRTVTGTPVTRLTSTVTGDESGWDDHIPRSGRVECYIPKLPLNAGLYVYNVLAETGTEMEDWVKDAGFLSVEQGDFFGTGRLIDAKFAVLVDHQWTLADQQAQSRRPGDASAWERGEAPLPEPCGV